MSKIAESVHPYHYDAAVKPVTQPGVGPPAALSPCTSGYIETASQAIPPNCVNVALQGAAGGQAEEKFTELVGVKKGDPSKDNQWALMYLVPESGAAAVYSQNTHRPPSSRPGGTRR